MELNFAFCELCRTGVRLWAKGKKRTKALQFLRIARLLQSLRQH